VTTSVEEWDGWLRRWSAELLAGFDAPDAFTDPAVTPAVVASGWLGFPGASEHAVTALEARLGTSLPPSYRSFLLASNGFLQPGMIVPRLLSTDRVDWYRAAHQDTIDVWQQGLANAGAAELAAADAFEPRLSNALQVSEVEQVGTAVYLLNPDVVGPDGEWEAFYFAHWVPGVRRYPSFRALMLAEQESWLEPPAPPPASRWRTFRDAVRWIFRST
jgi:hypothetical protein